MKYSQLVVLLGAASVSGMKLEKNQRSLFDTSLVMLEAGVPVPIVAPVVAKKLAEAKPVVAASPAKTAAASVKTTESVKTAPAPSVQTAAAISTQKTPVVPKEAIKSWQTDQKKAPSTDSSQFLTQSDKIEKSSFVSTQTENEVILDQQAEVDRKKKKKSGPTTLTIVQEFPKKSNNSQSKMELVQGKETNMNTQKDYSVENQSSTTLTIVQDFPKKKSDHSKSHSIEMVQGKANDFSITKGKKVKISDLASQEGSTLTIVQDFPKKRADHSKSHSIEMVQGKAKDFTIEAPSSEIPAHHVTHEKKVELNPFANDEDHGGSGSTLTIVQDFPKKQTSSDHVGSELVQADEHHESTFYERGVKKMAIMENSLLYVKTFIEDLFGVNK